MDGKELMGRVVKVDFARENPDRIIEGNFAKEDTQEEGDRAQAA